MKFAVIGGDMRLAMLAGLLAADSHEVRTFAIDKISALRGVTQTSHAEEAAQGADCVVLPLPLATREGVLVTPLSGGLYTAREIFAALSPEQVICAGKVDDASRETAGSMGLEIIDYIEREELAVANAVATAEGAVQLMMEETDVTLCRLNVLVIGFGRIGKLLCHRLRGMGAYVTAAARDYADIAWIRAYGYEAADTGRLEGYLSKFDVVVNTAPSRVLGYSRLRELKHGCLCLDLASRPGGVDFAAATRLGIKAVWSLGLPGEVAPVTAGAIIRDTVYNILSERGAEG
ncbi:MAG: dipicolinate synthase subunit DpsA [Oscillospiraceae bacterium]|jgi:dipicolinate synthase subunit A|nr:dipicolinate synthase subunit DpsA [Oscillospiraceae bacterium]